MRSVRFLVRALTAGTALLTVVAGVVTHRQRPATAQGITFINLEDETGFTNIVVSKGCWARHRPVARAAPAMLVKGRLELNGPRWIVQGLPRWLELSPAAEYVRAAHSA